MKAPLRRRLRSAVASSALRTLRGLLQNLPWHRVQSLGRGLGTLGWHLSRRDRRRALDHLSLAFPELSAAERRARARSCFRHLGMNLTELLHLAGRGPGALEDHLEIRGEDHVRGPLESGRALLVVTGHCGNWELLGPVFARLGIPLSAVVRALDEPRLHGILEELRRGFGTETIDRGFPGTARKLLAALRGGRALMMLIDQDIDAEGAWVSFFGRLAHTPVGAAKLALHRDAAVVPAFMERLEDGSHRARFLPTLDLPDDPTAATAVMTAAIEEQVRRRPEQWVWMHRRWRRRPPAEAEGTSQAPAKGASP